jgi:hypothetical protein
MTFEMTAQGEPSDRPSTQEPDNDLSDLSGVDVN